MYTSINKQYDNTRIVRQSMYQQHIVYTLTQTECNKEIVCLSMYQQHGIYSNTQMNVTHKLCHTDRKYEHNWWSFSVIYNREVVVQTRKV